MMDWLMGKLIWNFSLLSLDRQTLGKQKFIYNTHFEGYI